MVHHRGNLEPALSIEGRDHSPVAIQDRGGQGRVNTRQARCHQAPTLRGDPERVQPKGALLLASPLQDQATGRFVVRLRGGRDRAGHGFPILVLANQDSAGVHVAHVDHRLGGFLEEIGIGRGTLENSHRGLDPTNHILGLGLDGIAPIERGSVDPLVARWRGNQGRLSQALKHLRRLSRLDRLNLNPPRANIERDGQLELALLARHHDLRLTQVVAGREVGLDTEIGELDPPVRNGRDSGVLPRHGLLIVPGDHQPPCARLRFRELVEIRFRTRGHGAPQFQRATAFFRRDQPLVLVDPDQPWFSHDQRPSVGCG